MQAYTQARKEGKNKNPERIKELQEQILAELRAEDEHWRHRKAET